MSIADLTLTGRQMGARHNYQYITASLIDDRPLRNIPMRGVTYGWAKNAPGKLSGTMSVPAYTDIESLMSATTPGRTAIYVFRDYQPIWGGIIWKRSIGSNGRTVQLEADTFDSYMYHRILDQGLSFMMLYENDENGDVIVDPEFPGTDQTDMFRVLWSHMSGTSDLNGAYVLGDPERINSDIGVVIADEPRFTVARGRVFNRTDFKTYAEHLEALCNLTNGFDWVSVVRAVPEGSPPTASGVQRRIEFGYPALGRTWDKTRFIWEYPAALISWTWDGGADQATTAAYVVGKGEGDMRAYAIKRNDDALRDGWPLLDTVYNHSTVSSQETLASHAMKYLRAFSPPTGAFNLEIHPDMPPRFGLGNDEYFIGDEVMLQIDDAMFVEAEVRSDTMIVQINGIEVTPNDDGLEDVRPIIDMKGQQTGIQDPEEANDDLVPDDWPGPAIQPDPGDDIIITDQSTGDRRRVVTKRLYIPTFREWVTVQQESINGGPLSGWIRSRP